MKISKDETIGIDVDKSGRIWISDGKSIYSKNPYFIALSFNRYVKENNVKRVFIEDSREWNTLFKKQNPRLIQVLSHLTRGRLTVKNLITRVPPYNTSITCNKCLHIDKKSRISKTLFCCTKCKFKTHADINAARNIKMIGCNKLKIK